MPCHSTVYSRLDHLSMVTYWGRPSLNSLNTLLKRLVLLSQEQPVQETGCASHALPPCFLLIDKDEICSDLLEGEGGVLSYVTGVVVPLPFSVCVEYIYHVSRGGLGMKHIMVPICKRTTNCRYCFPISLYVYVPI